MRDNGRGIPVDKHPQYKVPALEIVMTKLASSAFCSGVMLSIAGRDWSISSRITSPYMTGSVAALARAGALGLYDAITHLFPVLYTHPGAAAAAALREQTTSVLDNTLALRPRHGRPLPMVPTLSWMTFGCISGGFFFHEKTMCG